MIAVTGDTHGERDLEKLFYFNSRFKNTLTKNDYVIVAGDFGLLWKDEEDGRELFLKNKINDCSFTTLFIDGNHENFNRLEKLEEIEMFDSKVKVVSDSIFMLKRGEVYNIDRKNILTIGGAQSIDKIYRTENISWWPQEEITDNDVNRALNNIKNKKIDYIISHAAPLEFYKKHTALKELARDSTPLMLQKIFDSGISFKKWFFGHYHVDVRVDEFICLYYCIYELE